jgi:ABC-type phosphate transport system substrate-binding protein
LIGGPLVGGARRFARPLATALGEIEAALRASGADWDVVRVGAGPGAVACTTVAVAAALRALRDRTGEVAMIVATGSVALGADGEPALVAEVSLGDASVSADATVPLRAFRRGDHERSASRGVTIVGAWTDGATPPGRPDAWLESLATTNDHDVITCCANDHVLAALEWLRIGIAGAAADPDTGTVTSRTLGAFLSRSVPGLAVRIPVDPSPASIAGDWTSQLVRTTAVSSRTATPGPAVADLVGTTLPGQFRLDAVVATGGFGTVYRARQLAVERDVAIKVMRDVVDVASPRGRLFVQEIQSVGKIDHRNVVRILHADLTATGHVFYAMELLPGLDLEQVLAAGTVERGRALELVDQVLDGLAAAHDAGLVHADIKPANIVVVPGRAGDRAVLIDFGMARLQSPDAGERSVGGTPAYMAPEQLRDGRVDVRSDVFSVGLVLVTLMTGWRRRAADQLVPPLDAIDDPALRAVLARATALEPGDRYATADELANALEALRPIESPARRRSRDRARATVITGLAIAGVLVAGLAGGRRGTATPRYGAGTIAGRPTTGAVVVGGSGTVMWGFVAPLNAFLESATGVEIPISSKNDGGSGGAIPGLVQGALDVAAFSSRFAEAVPREVLDANLLLVEVAIGFDETSLFVHRRNPLRSVDLADVRAHLCCKPGALAAAVRWRDLGLADPAFAERPITWVLFGRPETSTVRNKTSATLRLADEWLCAPDELCPSRVDGVQANEVVAAYVTDEHALALSSRSFATSEVVPVAIVDRARRLRLDGRKTLWMYIAVERSQPIGDRRCRFLSAVLDPAVAGRLAANGKAMGLPDALRQRQRDALGLDSGACTSTAVADLARRSGADPDDGVFRSPIAADVEVADHWVADRD